jgi:serine protease Do
MKNVALKSSIQALLVAAIFSAPTFSVIAQEPEKITPPAVKVDPVPVQTKAGFLTSFAPIVEKVAPSVVTISTTKNVRNGSRENPLFNDPNFRRFFGLPDPGPEQPPTQPKRGGNGQKNDSMQKQDLGLGSGVIVSSDGMILTNNHVIEGADDINVSIGINDQKYKAKKIAGDPDTDIAVLKIDAKDLKAVTFGDSDKIRVGDLALAIGNPFGLTQSISMGVVSALGRGGMGIVRFENFIQTDASINPGNSGGALVDIEGRLIGINTAIFSRSGGNQGIGFAVPANLAHSVMDNLIKNGRVVRGYLGVQPDAITEDLVPFFKTKDRKGALVSRVEPKTPAARAGIEVGDVILEVAGKKVEGPRELRLLISSMAPGAKVDLKVIRDGQEKTISVELGELPAGKAPNKEEEPKTEEPDVLDGVTVSDLDAATRKEFDLPEDAQGVLVTAVDPDSPSAAADIRKGDLIHEINRQPVTSAKQAIEISEKLKTEKKVLLRISRKGASRYIVVGQKD